MEFFADNLEFQVSTLYHEVERPTAVFVLGGVLERLPKLPIVSAENGEAWMPYFMWRIDFAHRRIGPLPSVGLRLKPSDSVKRHVSAPFIGEAVLLDGDPRYAVDRTMWSSDYPHTAAIWPHAGACPGDLERARD